MKRYDDEGKKNPGATVDFSAEKAEAVQKQKDAAKADKMPAPAAPSEAKVIVAKLELTRIAAGEAAPVKGARVEKASANAKQEAELGATAAFQERMKKDVKDGGVHAFKLRNVLEGRMEGSKDDDSDIERLRAYVKKSEEDDAKGYAMLYNSPEAVAAAIVFAQDEDTDKPYAQHQEKTGLLSRLKKLFGREE